MTKSLGVVATAPGRGAWMVVGVAGLLAGLMAFGLGELTYEYFPPEKVPEALGAGQVMRPSLATIARADAQNSALTFGMMGGVLGAVLGLAGGIASRSAASAIRGGLIGLFLGASIGVGLPLVVIEPFHRLQADRNSDDLLLPIGLHATLWGPLGAAGGLAFGVGRGRRGAILPSMLGGLFGAVLGAIAYDVLGAAFTPLAGTSEAISGTRPTRLMARLLIPLGTALGIALGAPADASRTAAAPDTAPTPDGSP